MVETESSSPASMSLVADEHSSQQKSDHQRQEIAPPTKKKRNLPGMPDPDAEVIALSPKTLLATNRFVCEICNKGFQRDQNLQLHRRGHNLPWKLRQRNIGEAARKRVYVCPEPTCSHHDPSRALGDLTGIKKHFCRKHGEKKFKCERCSKIYAVRSDWKAHMKTCGTREYPCDCGTLFSRRDSFITHRAFCDALAQESSRSGPLPCAGGGSKAQAEASPLPLPPPPLPLPLPLPPPASPLPPPPAAASPPPPPLTPPIAVLSPVLSVQSSAELLENQNAHLQPLPPPPPPGPAALTTSVAPALASSTTATTTTTTYTSFTASGSAPTTGGMLFATTIHPLTSEPPHSPHGPSLSYPTILRPTRPATDPISLSLSPSFYSPHSFFPPPSLNHHSGHLQSPQPVLSATALLQKAAQMGSTSSGTSYLRWLGLGLPSPSGPSPQHDASAHEWDNKLESTVMVSGLGPGLGLASSGSSGLNDLMMGPSFFCEKPPTLDFLGLGMGGDGPAHPTGFSSFLSNMGNESFGGAWVDGSSGPKPSL